MSVLLVSEQLCTGHPVSSAEGWEGCSLPVPAWGRRRGCHQGHLSPSWLMVHGPWLVPWTFLPRTFSTCFQALTCCSWGQDLPWD